MAGTHQQFVASASATFLTVQQLPTPITLPAVDGGNPVVMLQNAGPGPVWILAGTAANGGSLNGAQGAVLVQEGQTRVLQAAAGGLATGTAALIQAQGGGASVSFSRGALTPVWMFPSGVVT